MDIDTVIAEPLRREFPPLGRDGRLAPRSLFHEPRDGDLTVPHPDGGHCQVRR